MTDKHNRLIVATASCCCSIVAELLSDAYLGLLWSDTVDGEAALDVVDQTELLASLLDGDDI